MVKQDTERSNPTGNHTEGNRGLLPFNLALALVPHIPRLAFNAKGVSYDSLGFLNPRFFLVGWRDNPERVEEVVRLPDSGTLSGFRSFSSPKPRVQEPWATLRNPVGIHQIHKELRPSRFFDL